MNAHSRIVGELPTRAEKELLDAFSREADPMGREPIAVRRAVLLQPVSLSPTFGVGPFRWTSVGLAIDRQAGLSREESPWQSTDPIASNLSVRSHRSSLLARHCTVWRSAT